MSYLITIIPPRDRDRFTDAEIANALERTDAVERRDSETIVVRRAGGIEAQLGVVEGEIYTGQPEADVVAVMIQLAEKLGGRVRGENLETYRTPDDVYEHPDDSEERSSRLEAISRQRRKANRRRFLWICFPFFVFGVMTLLKVPAFWPKPATFPPSEHVGRVQSGTDPTGKFDIVLLPLSDFSDQFSQELALELTQLTGLNIGAVRPRAPKNLKPYPDSRQFDANAIVDHLGSSILPMRRRHGNCAVIVLTNNDLNSGERHTRFLFASGDYRRRVAVVSAHRLAEGAFIAFASEGKVQERMTKFCLRSIGELHYGFPRTTNPPDLMFTPVRGLFDVDQLGTNLLLDLDGKPRAKVGAAEVGRAPVTAPRPMHPIGVAMCVLGGTFAILGAWRNWDWFFRWWPAPLFVGMLGRSGARVFYLMLGIAVVTAGILASKGVI